jgi:hypothetical protein
MKDRIPKEISEQIVWKPQTNPDDFPVIDQIIHHAKSCEDCEHLVTDRRVHLRRTQQPMRHWSKYCATCTHYQNPRTLKFDATIHDVRAYWREVKMAATKKYWELHKKNK